MRKFDDLLELDTGRGIDDGAAIRAHNWILIEDACLMDKYILSEMNLNTTRRYNRKNTTYDIRYNGNHIQAQYNKSYIDIEVRYSKHARCREPYPSRSEKTLWKHLGDVPAYVRSCVMFTMLTSVFKPGQLWPAEILR